MNNQSIQHINQIQSENSHPLIHYNKSPKSRFQSIYPTINHIYDENGTWKREILESLRNSPQNEAWERALSDKWGRLAQGSKFGVQVTNTIDFITRADITVRRDVTYTSFLCDHRPLKTELWRECIVVDGNKLSYANDTGSPAASPFKTELLLNSTIPDAHKGTRLMCLDLKDFFIATPMQEPEFMKVPFKYFHDDIED